MLDGISAAGGGSPAQTTRTPDAVGAQDLIAQARDPRTGAVDTRALAGAVAQALPVAPDRASQAYADIEAALAQGSAADASRFNADVRDAVRLGADTAAGVSTGLSAAGKSLLVANPILSKVWQSTTSPWTGRGGFTPGLTQMLQQHGITVPTTVNPRPPGSVSRASGVPQAQANNINGAAARDQIAGRYRAAGAAVRTEVDVGGGRRVDVQADVRARDPRMNERIEVESKLGRTANTSTERLQAAKDGRALAENARLRGMGESLESFGRVARPLAIAGDAVALGHAFHADGDRIGVHTGETASGVAGGWAGAAVGAEGGAELGAVIGSVIPGAGTAAGAVVGGIVGGIVGGLGGDAIGRKVFDGFKSLF